jgi:hypothetical protein
MGINSSLNRTDYKKSILYKFIKQLDLQMFAIIGLAFLFVFSYLPITATNEVFNKLHHYNISQKEKPMKKMQSLISLCCRLIRIVYSLITKGQRFDPERLLKDIHRNHEVPVAA